MEVLKKIDMLCPCCMENHTLNIIRVSEHNIFKNISVDYNAEYFYCAKANETYADERQVSTNDISMKNAYRKKMGIDALL